jgi:uncharacterized protein
MLFAVYCLDKPDSQAVRAANRAMHLDHVARHEERILTAGPLFAEDGEAMVGSLLVLDFPDRAQLDLFLREDPYAKAGLFSKVDVRPYRAAFPKRAKE